MSELIGELIGNTKFLGLPLFKKGKVRDVYDFGDTLLIVSTDRISAFDVVFPNFIPCKGQVLNKISEFWFNYTKDIIDNHMITTNIDKFPKELHQFNDKLNKRAMLAKKASMIPAECIVRGYLEGSGLKEYKKTKSISGIELPLGLKQCEKLPEPIFTPTTKEEEGHDKSITFEELSDKLGLELAKKLKEVSISLYLKANEHAKTKGIIIADTKLEFGFMDGELIVADELFTPDSSRFWLEKDYSPGRPQKSFDKQYLREYLETIAWDKNPPAPKLPDYVIENTAMKYKEAYERITGEKILESGGI
jgi:phosphoribosylaminoimidazole-succinocarboxamide synthase